MKLSFFTTWLKGTGPDESQGPVFFEFGLRGLLRYAYIVGLVPPVELRQDDLMHHIKMLFYVLDQFKAHDQLHVFSFQPFQPIETAIQLMTDFHLGHFLLTLQFVLIIHQVRRFRLTGSLYHEPDDIDLESVEVRLKDLLDIPVDFRHIPQEDKPLLSLG